MYKFNGQLCERLFIKIPNIYFENMAWARLSTAGKAIYPVIRKFSNKEGICFPSQQTIAIVAGVTEKTVRNGLGSLKKFPGFSIEKYITQRGHYANRYKFESVSPKNSESISIGHPFFNGGNWSQLTPSAKAIYPVLKHYKWWDLNLYADLEGDVAVPFETKKCFKSRKFDFASPDISILAKISGINRKSVEIGLKSLIEVYFIEEIESIGGQRTFKIFTTKPPKMLIPEYLNEMVQKRFQSK
jgi:hypothetical protein